jgi:hypothetical protein
VFDILFLLHITQYTHQKRAAKQTELELTSPVFSATYEQSTVLRHRHTYQADNAKVYTVTKPPGTLVVAMAHHRSLTPTPPQLHPTAATVDQTFAPAS